MPYSSLYPRNLPISPVISDPRLVGIKKEKTVMGMRGWSVSKAGKVFAWHTANPGSTPSSS